MPELFVGLILVAGTVLGLAALYGCMQRYPDEP